MNDDSVVSSIIEITNVAKHSDAMDKPDDWRVICDTKAAASDGFHLNLDYSSSHPITA